MVMCVDVTKKYLKLLGGVLICEGTVIMTPKNESHNTQAFGLSH